MTCLHTKVIVLNDDDRKEYEAEILALISKEFPGYPDDEVREAAFSPMFQFAHCERCDAIVVRMA